MIVMESRPRGAQLATLTRAPAACAVPGCDKRHYARGLCAQHYTQLRRHGRLTPENERGAVHPCAAPGCDRAARPDGFCRKHLTQVRKHGRLTPEREHARPAEKTCTVGGCDRPHRAHGLCAFHYRRRGARRRSA